jgi:hypothetical protein
LPAQRGGVPASGAPAQGRGPVPPPGGGGLFPPAARLIIYGAVFLLGYFLANILSAWEHQRFVESVLASNGFAAVLRLGLADELDRLRGDLAAIAGGLEAARSPSEPADSQLPEVRDQLATAARRLGAIKSRYGNPPAEDDLLRRLLRDNLAKLAQSPAAEARPETKPDDPVPSKSEPGAPSSSAAGSPATPAGKPQDAPSSTATKP